MYLGLRVFIGIDGDLITLIKHVGTAFVMRGKQLNAFEKGQADAWSAEGVSHREIARRLKCHHATIVRFLKRFKATGDFKQLKGRGRKCKISA